SLVQATEGIRLSESIHCLTSSIVIMLASRGAADARRKRSPAKRGEKSTPGTSDRIDTPPDNKYRAIVCNRILSTGRCANSLSYPARSRTKMIEGSALLAPVFGPAPGGGKW